MAQPSTRPTGEDVTAFLDSVSKERRRAEGHEARAIFERVTGEPAVMWGPSIVGFGAKPLTNTSGTNDWPIVAFSPRSGALTLYGFHDPDAPDDPLLQELGPHTTGKSCVYIKRLADIDTTVLERLIDRVWRREHDPAS